MRLKKKYSVIAWGMIGPAVLLIVFTKFYPIFEAFRVSLTSGTGLNQTYVGISNYARVLEDGLFKTALFNTVFYLIQVPIMLILALILASLLNSSTLKLKGIFRTAIFLPCIMATVSYSMVFRTLFSKAGMINSFLMNLGIIDVPIAWLESAWIARIVIVVAMTWRWTGYNTIFYLAGLQNIDDNIYEAARIDGANIFQQFRKITIPLLRPIILLTTITSINGTLQLFAETQNITSGGPGNATITLSNYIYKLSFVYVPQFGYASTIAFIVLIMVAVLAFVQMKMGDTR
jgi:lactose/L-arabinose transport system permease protein